MIKYIKKIIRGWAREFFRKQIKCYKSQVVITPDMMFYDFWEDKQYVERELVFNLAKKMHEDGLIEFEQREEMITGNKLLTAKIRLI